MKRILAGLWLLCLLSACSGDNTPDDTPQPLSVLLTADPLAGAAPLPVNFSAVVPDADSSVGYTWTFGSGATEQGSASRAFTFAEPGSYPVTVEATRGDQRASASVTVEVTPGPVDPTNQPPVVELAASTTTGKAPLAIDFSATAVDPDGDALSYSWNFGDGATVAPSGETVQTHTFAQAGAYGVTVTVADGRGGVHEATLQIAVTDPDSGGGPTPPLLPGPEGNQPPTVELSANTRRGAAPLTVSFSADASDPEGSDLEYAWDFGNGETVEGNVSHTVVYTDPGSYDVNVRVSDGLASEQKTIKVQVDSPITPPGSSAPTLDISATPTSGNAPLTVAFSAQVSDASGSALSYVWDFGDGTISGEQSPTHLYRDGGPFTASLTVGNRSGGKTRKELAISVAGDGGGSSNPDVPFYGEWSWSAETPAGKTYQGYLSISRRTPDSDDFGDTFIEGGTGTWMECPDGLESPCNPPAGTGYIDVVNYGSGEEFDIGFTEEGSGLTRLSAFDTDDILGNEVGGAPTFRGGGAWFFEDGNSEELSFVMVKIAEAPVLR